MLCEEDHKCVERLRIVHEFVEDVVISSRDGELAEHGKKFVGDATTCKASD